MIFSRLPAALVCALVLTIIPAVASAAPEVDCTLTVPAHPLTAAGLATPWYLGAGCHEADSAMSAFVEATVLDPATGALSTYKPLVIDQGAVPLVVPTLPALPAYAVVGIGVGFNGDNLTLTGPGAAGCVNGTPGSIFGQVSFCNSVEFYAAANAAVVSGLVPVPPRGVARDGQQCPSAWSWVVVDQDPIDNTDSVQRVVDGQVIQNTVANRAAYPTSRTLGNPGDFRLLNAFLNPALGCTPWRIRDLTDPDPSAVATSQHTDELQARFTQVDDDTALAAAGDPMAFVDDLPNPAKLNVLRANVDQPPANGNSGSTKTFCRGLLEQGLPRIALDRPLTIVGPAPNATVTNLYGFVTARFAASWELLGCGALLGLQNPIALTVNASGQVTDATITLHPARRASVRS